MIMLPLLALLPLAGAAAAQDAARNAAPRPDAAVAGPVVPQPDSVMMLRLRGGSTHWGAIEDHSRDGVDFRLLSTGGLAHVPWRFVDPAQDHELRTRFGYVEVSGDEVMVEADKLVLADGDELIGKITAVTEKDFLFKVRGAVLNVPKIRVRSSSSGVQAPALDVYTKDELYNLERAQLDPEDPDQQWELARFCERILDYRRALEHYRAVEEIDPDHRDGELAAVIPRVEVKAERQEQVDHLEQIDHMMRRKRYDDALAELTVFDGLYPDSPLASDRHRLEQRILEARAAHAEEIVRLAWFRRMERLAADAARDRGYEGALAYLDEAMGQELLAAVTAEVAQIWPDVTPEIVTQLWIDRDRGRWRPASYGLGTWLLGEDQALAGMESRVAEAEAQSDVDRQRAELEERLDRFLKNQENQRRARRSADQEGDVEAYWQGLSHASRTKWLVAYFVENSGLFDVRPKPELHDCRSCGGTGIREIIFTGNARSDSTGGGTQRRVCETCRGIGKTRRVRYR